MSGLQVDPARLGQARTKVGGLTQAAAARQLRVHPVTLNKIENGKAKVSLELLERMAALYGCTRGWLLGEPEQVDPIDQARERLAGALAKIHTGFDDLADLVETLNGRASGHAAKAAV